MRNNHREPRPSSLVTGEAKVPETSLADLVPLPWILLQEHRTPEKHEVRKHEASAVLPSLLKPGSSQVSQNNPKWARH